MIATSANLRLAESMMLVRRRLLLKPGDVLVRVGDHVEADDVVARSMTEGPLRVIDVAAALHSSPDVAYRHLRVVEGQTVSTGMELATWQRLGLRIGRVVSPCQGIVAGIHEGLVFLRQEPRPIDLLAYIPGQVMEVFPHRGVSIRTTGALVGGIWASGPDRHGVLVISVPSPDTPLTWQQVGIRYRGTILVGGTLQDPRVLYRARQFRVHGVIVGSMEPSLCSLCERLELTVVVTEGMGQIPMAEPAFNLLNSLHGRMALIGGAQQRGGNGPEIIVPRPEGEARAAVEQPYTLQAGTLVRLTRPPYVGTVARVESLPSNPQRTEVGIPADGAHVRTPDGKRLFVPLANLEVLA